MKKHLKSNMTIIGIIRVFKRAPRGLLKDPADDGSAGSLLAGLGINETLPRDTFYKPEMKLLCL